MKIGFIFGFTLAILFACKTPSQSEGQLSENSAATQDGSVSNYDLFYKCITNHGIEFPFVDNQGNTLGLQWSYFYYPEENSNKMELGILFLMDKHVFDLRFEDARAALVAARPKVNPLGLFRFSVLPELANGQSLDAFQVGLRLDPGSSWRVGTLLVNAVDADKKNPYARAGVDVSPDFSGPKDVVSALLRQGVVRVQARELKWEDAFKHTVFTRFVEEEDRRQAGFPMLCLVKGRALNSVNKYP